jgi:hypothetical protein
MGECLINLGEMEVGEKRKKNLVNKNEGCEPIHQKYKAYEKTSRQNQKLKQKQTISWS